MIVKGLVSLVIPNFNGRDLLLKNLPKVIESSRQKSNSIKEIIVVDDCSTDDSVKVLEDRFPKIVIVRHKMNRGFSASVNTGVRSATGKYVCLLNSDVIPSKYFLKPVFALLKQKDVFAVSLSEKDYSWARGMFTDGYINHEIGTESKTIHLSFWASGGSGIFKRSVWFELGGMDEKLFKFYWEDVDLSYRAQKRGYKIYWDPNAHVIHKHESTTSKVFSIKKKNEMVETNQLLFIWKNLTSPRMFNKHVEAVVARIIKHPGYIRIVLKALRKINLVLKAREKEIKETKVSDETIFSRFN